MATIEPGASILPPSDDRIFKLLLTHPDAKPVLMDVISAVIDRNVIDVQVRNNEVPPNDIDEKMERFDVNAVIDGGEQVDLEMQASAMEEKLLGGHANLIKKYLYYLTDLHSSQSSKGKAYDELVKTYQVTFCTYAVFPKELPYVNKFSMRTKDGYLLCDDIHAIFIELSKIADLLQKSVDKMTSLEMWSLFLNYASEPKYRDKVNEIILAKEVIGVATDLLTSISQDEKERAIFRSRRMYQTDLTSNIRTAEKRGEERGIVIGEERGIAIGEALGEKKLEKKINEVALGMKQNNIPINVISLITGLAPALIENINLIDSSGCDDNAADSRAVT